MCPRMAPRTLLDYLTCTRIASWSDRSFHGRRLARHGLVAEKVYLLGYATDSPATVQRIRACVQRRSARCLGGVFRELPWGEDAFGSTPIGPMCAVYVLLDASRPPQVVVLTAESGRGGQLHVPAKFFPYQMLVGKTLVSWSN